MRQQIQKFGRALSGMVMPNIGAFIAWGIITALFIPTGWLPNEYLANVGGPMSKWLIPLLIGYTGGSTIYGHRGGVLAALGGAMYIIVTVGTILFGKRLDSGAYSPKVTPLRLPVEVSLVEDGGHGGGWGVPGTFVLAMVFLVAFVLYYFVNWKYLGQLWGLS